ncbi:DUF6817 domain-containing protein [Rhizobium ruizarguesonis]|uniref:DUF6817 domain-containing protein n=1 Tax=Rhizobium ruizarguesonis TaxID=2081791 RepID=UPI003857C2AA
MEDSDLTVYLRRSLAFIRDAEWRSIRHGELNLALHSIGVFKILRRLNAPAKVQLAGLLHAVYGAESFSSLRPSASPAEVRLMVGYDAERLIDAYSRVEARSLAIVALARNRGFLADRFTSKPLTISDEDLTFVIMLLYCNLIEQYVRSKRRGSELFLRQGLESQPSIYGLAHILGQGATQLADDLYSI